MVDDVGVIWQRLYECVTTDLHYLSCIDQIHQIQWLSVMYECISYCLSSKESSKTLFDYSRDEMLSVCKV